MNSKIGLIGVVMTVLVGIILIGSVLAPTISEIKVTAGDEITKTNSWTYGPNMSALEGEFKMTATADDVIKINDVAYTGLGTHAPYFMSDKCIIYGASTYLICYIVKTDETTTTTVSDTFSSATATFDFEASDGLITVSNGTTTATTTYTWAYAYDPSGEYNYVSMTLNGTSRTIYWSDVSDFVFCGDYTSGENDTFYSVKDGVCYNAAGYDMSLTIPETIADGTTDIYGTDRLDIKITMDDETYTPYNCLVKYEVSGHATEGAVYNLYGVVLVLAIVGIAVVGIRSFLGNRD